MENTLNSFKAKQAQSLAKLEKLAIFLDHGEKIGIPIEPKLQAKLETVIRDVADDKLKVALIGGFSEGKTAIAAAWMERLDKSSMIISHQESSNEVKTYEVDSDLVLIDTPGLFGFKEQYNAEEQSIEKYKDIAKKYVSEAHLILYVMDPVNPIKESHKDDLVWLFRTLNLLPRTVFVLSRFDAVADVESDSEYRQQLAIKRDNVVGRLRDMIGVDEQEISKMAIVAVAANPFEMGIDYWLSNLDKFKTLSHISQLQDATSELIKSNGGALVVVDEAKKSVIRDVLNKLMPIAVDHDERVGQELERLQNMNTRLQKQLNATDGQIADVRRTLRGFVTDYFSDLILQAKGLSLDTFTEFFEREVGTEGIVLTSRLQNEFERQLGAVTLEVRKVNQSFEAEVNHFNMSVMELGKQGVNYVIKGKLVNTGTVLAARDGIVTMAKTVGLDLGSLLKFKPWGAVNLAKGVNGALAFAGLALEAWDTWEKYEREAAFRMAIDELVQNFEKQREELLALLNGSEFTEQFFGNYIGLKEDITNLQESVKQGKKQREAFRAWREMGKAISVDFPVLQLPNNERL